MFCFFGKFYRVLVVDSRFVWWGYQWFCIVCIGINLVCVYLIVLLVCDFLCMFYYQLFVEEIWLLWYFSLMFEYNIVILYMIKFLKVL